MVSFYLAPDEPQSEATAKWPYRTTVLFLVGPGIALWATVIALCIRYL